MNRRRFVLEMRPRSNGQSRRRSYWRRGNHYGYLLHWPARRRRLAGSPSVLVEPILAIAIGIIRWRWISHDRADIEATIPRFHYLRACRTSVVRHGDIARSHQSRPLPNAIAGINRTVTIIAWALQARHNVLPDRDRADELVARANAIWILWIAEVDRAVQGRFFQIGSQIDQMRGEIASRYLASSWGGSGSRSAESAHRLVMVLQRNAKLF